MTDCIVNQDILNNCLSYDYGGIDRIFLLPFDEFQALEQKPKYAAFSSAFNKSFKIGKGGYYTSILSTSKFVEVQVDDTSTFKNVFQSHSYQQTLTTKVRRIDEELDNLLSKNKNKKFVVVVFPNINNKIWETFYNKQTLISNFCFFMGVENGCTWSIQYDVEQKGGGSAYTIQFTANSYQSLPTIEDINDDWLVEENVINYKYIPKEYICVGNTNYEVAQYAIAVTNDRNQQPIDRNSKLCSESGLKQAIYTYIDVDTYKEYLIANLNDYDIIGVFDIDAIFEGRKVKRYNTICYNYYNLQLYFKDYPTETALDEVFDFEGETISYGIECIGKSAKYTVSSTVSWITTNVAADNTLTLTIAKNEAEASRSGKITLTHKDDSSLKLVIDVTQAKNIIKIPPFDYLTFRYFWGTEDGRDLDTSTGYVNTGIVFSDGKKLDELPVGWAMAGNYNTNAQSYLMFAGDNTGSGNECVYITMNTLSTHYDELPDIVEIDVYANWFGERKNGNTTFQLTAYEGGAMVQNGYNFENVGGREIMITQATVNVRTQGTGMSGDYKNKYYKIGTIYYDKTKRTATYVLNN